MRKVVCKEVLTGKNGLLEAEWTARIQGNSVDVDPLGCKSSKPGLKASAMVVLADTFLPVGYPNSVRKEYIIYQFWDSVQGMSSYLRAVLTTRSVLAGAGVGSASSSALAAALTWVFRDGIGMIGSLAFAYRYADTFEVYIKEWRYLADVLNNIGLTLDLLSSSFPRHYVQVTSISTLCKACCGLIAGATKARISAHFARPGHLADVTAKESTQETAIALCGLVLGMALAQLIGHDDVSIWVTFLLLLGLHQYSNYQLVKVLVFPNLNPQRCQLLAEHTALEFKAQQATAAQATPHNTSDAGSSKVVLSVPPSTVISKQETFLRPVMLSYVGPIVGGSLQEIIKSIQFVVVNRSGQFPEGGLEVRTESEDLTESLHDPQFHSASSSVYALNVCELLARLSAAWASEEFMIGVNPYGRVVIALSEGISRTSIVKAYLVGYYVQHKLRVPPTLFLASHSSRHRFLTEIYQYILNTLAHEALQWFAALSIGSPVPVPVGADPDDVWDWSDVSALAVGGYRYQPLQISKRSKAD